MDLYLTRLLCAASLLLALGAIAARVAWRTRGAAAAHEVLRLAFAGVALCALLPAAPAPLPPVATPLAPVATPPAASRTTPAPALAPAPPPAATAPTDPPAAPAPTPPNPRATLLGLWALGAAVGLGQLLRGHLLLKRLRRESRPARVETPVPVPVRESDRLDAPLLAGCLRPVLYLPAAGPVRDEPDALAAALAHESAHLTRRDLPWILLACLVRALLWFHPLVHLGHRLLHQSAEEACDEAAVAATRDRRAYADLLLRLSAHTPAPVPSAGMASFRTRTGQRIAALLSDRLSRPLSLRGRLALRIGTAALLVVGTSLLGRQRLAAQTPLPPTTPVPVRRTVTLSVRDRPLAEVVAALSKGTRWPLQLHPSLRGTVTLDARDETIEAILPRLCAQIRPAAWYVPVQGVAYRIGPLPPVGRVAGRLLAPDGKPLAGVTMVATARVPRTPAPDSPDALVQIAMAVTNRGGDFVLERVGARPYLLSAFVDASHGGILRGREIAVRPGTTTRVGALRLERGATLALEADVPDADGIAVEYRFALSGDASPVRLKQSPDGNALTVRVPAGPVGVSLHASGSPLAEVGVVRAEETPGREQGFVADKGTVRFVVRDGERVRLRLKGTLTPAHLAERLRRKVESDARVSEIQTRMQMQQRLWKSVSLPTAPTPIADAVRAVCAQAGIDRIAIAPGIGGSVRADVSEGPMGSSLERLCLRATPPAFPVWKGDRLDVVAAPAPGARDPVHQIYRLKGLHDPFVVLEENVGGGIGSVGDMATTVTYHDALGDGAVTVTVRVQAPNDGPGLPGMTVLHEHRGTVKRLRTDRAGTVSVSLRDGRNYFYLAPGSGRVVANGSHQSGDRGEIKFQVMDPVRGR